MRYYHTSIFNIVNNFCKVHKLSLSTALETVPGIKLVQNFQATLSLPPGNLEQRFNKQSDSRLHVAALITLFTFRFIVAQSHN